MHKHWKTYILNEIFIKIQNKIQFKFKREIKYLQFYRELAFQFLVL